jgi:hypothetical protein
VVKRPGGVMVQGAAPTRLQLIPVMTGASCSASACSGPGRYSCRHGVGCGKHFSLWCRPKSQKFAQLSGKKTARCNR